MDPYKILGVSPKASDDEIKQAYRELARKYHPDKYINNPLSDLAQEKMKQINEAYDQIVKMRSGSENNYSAQGSYNSQGQPPIYNQIRQMINMNNILQAEIMLNQITDRTAEWFFLRGSIDMKRGWFDQARRNFETASSMDPGNVEYQRAIQYMNTQGASYRNVGQNNVYGCSPCDVCTSFMCADCCCECMGGNLC